MSCEICGRGDCCRSFHSLGEQERFDATVATLQRPRRKTYDKGCYELAMGFLGDSNAHADKVAELADLLAVDIQQAIEDFFAERNLA